MRQDLSESMAQRKAIACSAAVSKLFRSILRSESWLATSTCFRDGSAFDSSFVSRSATAQTAFG